MTIQLYVHDHYLKEFDSKVNRIDGNYVEIEQTAFYAESGGQSGDSGVLNNEKVLYTKFIEKRHVHVMENEPSFAEGDAVRARHIMEYFLLKHFGNMKRTGSMVEENKDRADYKHIGRLDQYLLKKVEEDTNNFIKKGLSYNNNRILE
jgi:Ser-tRNA(Ala) deacylase AlaX